MKFEQFVDQKIREISKEKVILDVGGGNPFTKWLANYKELFKDCDYKTLDYDASTAPTIVGDIHNIPLPGASIDAVICHSVLEHVHNPIKAMEEIYRVLKPGGKVFLHVPSIYPYHARKGHYGDYWRFFDDTLLFLFKDFSKVEIVKRGGYFKALLFFMPFQHKLRFVIDPLSVFLDTLFKTDKRTTTSGFYVYAVK
jgi:ubiquinone/menaquinone biosynthesis C-methylase UbiE